MADGIIGGINLRKKATPLRRGRRLAESNKKQSLLKVYLAGLCITGLLLTGFGTYKWLQKAVMLDVDGTQIPMHTFQKTVGDLLAEAGVELGEKDLVVPATDAALEDGLVVQVIRAFPLEIQVDGQTLMLLTTPIPVSEALATVGVALAPLDRVEPGLADLADKPGQIRVVRVQQAEVTEEQEVPYRVEQRSDTTLERGLRRIVSRGREGLERHTMKVTYEDGVAVNRELLAQEVLRPPVSQVVAMGTIDQVSRGSLNFRFREAKHMVATAYTHTGRNTASGVYPGVGMVAVDTRVIPMGSRLYVEGYGYATAADRGRAIVGDRVDVFMETEGEAKRWGVKTVKVYILE
ncbi:MAG: G5 domain-containing protein [Heliobacteriaceae bacterium]|nr:G5 domain-containing protein [Heliobacteriaceae bacterium]MDD4587619.1 G5 domain-containing protein [Heliobacteriaceae bacterium]